MGGEGRLPFNLEKTRFNKSKSFKSHPLLEDVVRWFDGSWLEKSLGGETVLSSSRLPELPRPVGSRGFMWLIKVALKKKPMYCLLATA